jgi:preprotein translocase subunit SecE
MAKDQSAKVVARRAKGPPQKSAQMAKTTGPNAVQTPVAPARPRTSPAQFWNEVRAEARKITWTSWKETWITSVMVGIMVVITAIFFMVVDGALNFLVTQLLKLASG